MLEAAEAKFLIEAKDDLGIASRVEVIALHFERPSDPLEIVDLAVRHDDHVAVLTLKRLVTRCEIDDREPRMREGDLRRGIDEQASAVRSPVTKHLEDAF